MNRLIEKIVFWGFVTCFRRAGVPPRRWPSFVNATTDGGARPPSAFGTTGGSPPSRTAMHELDVPRSTPLGFAFPVLCLLVRKSKPFYSRSFAAFWTGAVGLLTGPPEPWWGWRAHGGVRSTRGAGAGRLPRPSVSREAAEKGESGMKRALFGVAVLAAT